MQSPREKRIDTGKVDMIEVSGGEVDIVTLPSQEVNGGDNDKNTDTSGR